MSSHFVLYSRASKKFSLLISADTSNAFPCLHPAVSTASLQPQSLFSQPLSMSSLPTFAPQAALTDYFNFVCCVDFSNFVKHSAGVFPTVLWLQVLQVQRPLLLLVLPNLLGREGLIVLQPRDVGPWVPAGHALQADGAADRTGDHSPSHLGRLCEPGLGCKRQGQLTVVSKGHIKKNTSIRCYAKFA